MESPKLALTDRCTSTITTVFLRIDAVLGKNDNFMYLTLASFVFFGLFIYNYLKSPPRLRHKTRSHANRLRVARFIKQVLLLVAFSAMIADITSAFIEYTAHPPKSAALLIPGIVADISVLVSLIAAYIYYRRQLQAEQNHSHLLTVYFFALSFVDTVEFHRILGLKKDLFNLFMHPATTFQNHADAHCVCFIVFAISTLSLAAVSLFSEPSSSTPPESATPVLETDETTPLLMREKLKKRKLCPEMNSSMFSRMVFGWVNPMISLGYNDQLTHDDLWDLRVKNKSAYTIQVFEKEWSNELEKHKKNPMYKPKLLWTLIKSCSKPMLPAIAYKFIYDLTNLILPQFLKLIICFMSNPEVDVYYGYLIALSLLITSFLQTVFLHQYFHRVSYSGMRIHSALVAMIYKKSLLISPTTTFSDFVAQQNNTDATTTTLENDNTSEKQFATSSAARKLTQGEVMNLMTIDAQRLNDVCMYINLLWSCPLQLVLSLYFLYDTIGISVLAGALYMVLLVPVNIFVAKIIKSKQLTQMKIKDKRMKVMTETLGGIKVIKFFAYEKFFLEKILRIREEEVFNLRNIQYFNSGFSFFWVSASIITSIFTFTSYILLGNTLTPEVAFTSLALFNVLQFPLSFFPFLINSTSESLVSLNRLHSYFMAREIDPENVINKSVFVLPPHETDVLLDNTISESINDQLEEEDLVHESASLFPFHSTRRRDNIEATTTDNSLAFFNTTYSNASCTTSRFTSFSKDLSLNLAINVNHGNFSWLSPDTIGEAFQIENSHLVLRDIHLSLQHGKLAAVLGKVAAGKSSLVSAILGELYKASGTVTINGSIAIVSQQSWIQNMTIRENILFGKPYHPSRYAQIIHLCQLDPDLAIMPAGDQTEIGEKGINLSGGQKARIAIARAVYQDTDIYIFDDPLSALDSYVGKRIFDDIIGPNGLLKEKARLLITHKIDILTQCDFIYVMNGGRVQESGTFESLQSSTSDFQSFMQEHNNATNSSSSMQNKPAKKDKQEEDSLLVINISNFEEKRFGQTPALETVMGEDDHIAADPQQPFNIKEIEHASDNAGIMSDTDDLMLKQSDQKVAAVSLSEKVKIGMGAPPAPITPTPISTSDKAKLIDEELMVHGLVDFKIWKTYIKAQSIPVIFCTFVILASSTFLSVSNNLWLSNWTNQTKLDPEHVDSMYYLKVYALLGLMVSVLASLFTLVFTYGSYISSIKFHNDLLKNVIRTPMSFFDTTPMGRIINRFSKDINNIDQSIPGSLRMFLDCLFKVSGVFIIVSLSSHLMLIVIVPILVIYMLVQRYFICASRQLKRIESITRSPYISQFQETLSGLQVIRAFNHASRFKIQNKLKIDFNHKAFYASIASSRWLAVRLETIGTSLSFFTVLFSVLYRGSVAPSLVGLCLSNTLSISQSLNWLVRCLNDCETNMVSVERIVEYIDLKQEAPAEMPESSPPAFWPSQGIVEFKNVGVRYRENLDLAIRNISFKTKLGEKIGIVGTTGSGKSTMTLTLFRILELAEGAIYIDGVDISKIGLTDLRQAVSIIPQDPFVFAGTIRSNVDPLSAYTDAQIWDALQHSKLCDFVRAQHDGLDFKIDEGGSNLSVGQRSLLGLARAILKNSKIVVLDEATANIDVSTDAMIQKSIRQEFKDALVISIAHRLNTIIDYDRILVLQSGNLIEFDTPQNLLANKHGAFYKLAFNAGLAPKLP